MKKELRWFKKPSNWHLIAKTDKNYQNAYSHQEFKKMIYDFNEKERNKLEKDARRIIAKYELKFS